jgi:hypothetical protein
LDNAGCHNLGGQKDDRDEIDSCQNFDCHKAHWEWELGMNYKLEHLVQ